jgi:D-serine deaminase-like pyridoxal phosphate-dependent protein
VGILSDYETLKEATKNLSPPFMVVDLETFDANARELANKAKAHGKKLRLASKSIRVPALIKRLFDIDPETFQGIMCFSAAEARFLAGEGLDDFLVAYPSIVEQETADAIAVAKSGKTITLMVDSIYQVDAIDVQVRATSPGLKLELCIDVDMSLRRLGGLVHLGVQRSPIRSLQDFQGLAEYIKTKSSVKLAGVMGYESQVAGLPDKNPFAPMQNFVKAQVRRLSVKNCRRIRGEIANYLKANAIQIRFFNGGGTGSMAWTPTEPWLTEVTAGSGFLQSHLFDYYSEGHTKPAFCFALPISRFSGPGFLTVKSGGFISSGESSRDKAPIVHLPKGLETIATEGFGEVQTPLKNKSNVATGQLGPIFFRPSKAGEIAERFDSYHLLQDGKVLEEVPTYRGLGKTFY